VDELIRCVTSVDTKMYLVSNGGLKDQKGSFGSSAGTNAIKLHMIDGPSPGYDEHVNSYCSEAYSLLAGTNFLCLLLKPYQVQIPPSCNMFMFSDNL
jgi:hypothetical protein